MKTTQLGDIVEKKIIKFGQHYHTFTQKSKSLLRKKFFKTQQSTYAKNSNSHNFSTSASILMR